MSGTLNRLGRRTAGHPWITIGVWIAVAVTVVVASMAFGRPLSETDNVPGLDSQRAADLLSATGSADAGLTAQVVVTPRAPDATLADAGDARRDLGRLRGSLLALPNVVAVMDPLAALASDPAAAARTGAVSRDGRVAVLRVQYPVREGLDAGDLTRLKQALHGGEALHVEAGGDLFFAFEEPGFGAGEVAGLVVAMVVLFVAFGSVVAMGLPILTALFGLGIGLGGMGLLAHLVEIPSSFAPVMASMVGLGVGIDYALFIVSRHREHLSAGLGVVEAAGAAVAGAGRAVLFAGGTVVVAILGLAMASIPMVTAAGIAISVVVAIMVAASLTLIPALLGLAGHRISPSRRRGRAADRAVTDRWHRWGAHVARRRVAYLVAGIGLLAAMAAPLGALRLGVPDDGTLPDSRTERRAYDTVAAAFGPGVNGPFLIAVDTRGDTSVVSPLAAAVAADPGIAAVAPPRVDRGAGVATIVATPTTAPQDAATRRTLERLRTRVFPAVLTGSPASAHVGGQTAGFTDMSRRVQDRLLAFIATVVGLSFVLLLVVFRSVVVAVKAAVLNLLSIGASYGVLVMVFQWGWGASLIGLESTVPIVSFVPLLVFAIVFGLSMDYEVFLLSRIREHHLAGAAPRDAVVAGLAGTARVITSAALIMIAVFLGFVSGPDPTIKMLGLGLATAILVDATIVRMVLVPAAMAMFGRANWWMPKWLARVLPGSGHTEAPAAGDLGLVPSASKRED
ncbi:MAG: MMPL family transporter [Thermoleophilia bacterium]